MTHYVYRQYDVNGQLLYVGAAACVWNRMVGHKRDAEWIELVAGVDIESFPSKAEALIAERRAIFEERPIYNVGSYRDPTAHSHPDCEACARVRRRNLEYKRRRHAKAAVKPVGAPDECGACNARKARDAIRHQRRKKRQPVLGPDAPKFSEDKYAYRRLYHEMRKREGQA